MKRHYFTLAELLVIISIFAIILSLLSPSLQSIHLSAEKILCQNNLKEFGLAEQNHCEDYNGFFSPIYLTNTQGKKRVQWMENIVFRSYFKDYRVPRCPQVYENSNQFKLYGKNINSGHVGDVQNKAINIYNMTFMPNKKVIVSDSTFYLVGAYSVTGRNGWMNLGERSYRGAAFRHLNTANAAFFDGHAESLDLAEHIDHETHLQKFYYNKVELEKPFSYLDFE